MKDRLKQNPGLHYLGIPVPALPDSIIPVVRPNLAIMPNSDQYVWPELKRGLAGHMVRLSPAFSEADTPIIEPSSRIEADLTVVCHVMAKSLRKSPVQIARELAIGFNSSQHSPYINEAMGQGGYLNFLLQRNYFSNRVLSEIEGFGDHYGEQNIGGGKTAVIDCSSPNVAKYMSVGHLRSTIIGESLARINKAVGYTVIRDNHLGDWGTQFGMLVRAHELWADDYEELRDGTNPVQGLYKLYVRIHEEVEKEKQAKREELGFDEKAVVETQLEQEGRVWFQRLEQGDEQAVGLLRWATEQSLTEFQRVYDMLGTQYEYLLGESFYIPMIPAVLQYMREKKIAAADETGATVVDLSAKNLNRLVVQKSDGTSLYSTRDLATLVARSAWFNPDKITYVVGEDQQEYFQQIFSTFDMMTGNAGPKTEHVHFGMIRLPEGKMSTRAGRVIFLEDVLNESIERARKKTDELSKDLTEEEKDTIAKQIGVGAVVFFDLGQARERSISFDWDRALSFTGRSAPYIQYAHARMAALLRRAEKESFLIRTDITAEITDQSEFLLAKQLSKLPEAILQAGAQNSPDILADCVYQTAGAFTDFYGKVNVFGEPDLNTKNTRLRLTSAAACVIKKGLDLLCIEAPDRM